MSGVILTAIQEDGAVPTLVRCDERGRLQVDTAGLLTVVIEYDGTNAEYVGEAVPGSLQSATVWRIKKITYDGNDNPTDIKWADGVSSFTKEWDERPGYAYS